MTEQYNKISVRDVIDLYKINKSIDMANKSKDFWKIIIKLL